jgi:acyl carrier protein
MGDCCSLGATRERKYAKSPEEQLALWYALVLQMNDMASVKEQLKPIILKSLRITDLTPEDLRDDQPLLGGELEIDSIDILQLILEIERHFGIKLVQANFNQKSLESINALAAIIETKVAEARP